VVPPRPGAALVAEAVAAGLAVFAGAVGAAAECPRADGAEGMLADELEAAAWVEGAVLSSAYLPLVADEVPAVLTGAGGGARSSSSNASVGSCAISRLYAGGALSCVTGGGPGDASNSSNDSGCKVSSPAGGAAVDASADDGAVWPGVAATRAIRADKAGNLPDDIGDVSGADSEGESAVVSKVTSASVAASSADPGDADGVCDAAGADGVGAAADAGDVACIPDAVGAACSVGGDTAPGVAFHRPEDDERPALADVVGAAGADEARGAAVCAADDAGDAGADVRHRPEADEGAALDARVFAGAAAPAVGAEAVATGGIELVEAAVVPEPDAAAGRAGAATEAGELPTPAGRGGGLAAGGGEAAGAGRAGGTVGIADFATGLPGIALRVGVVDVASDAGARLGAGAGGVAAAGRPLGAAVRAGATPAGAEASLGRAGLAGFAADNGRADRAGTEPALVTVGADFADPDRVAEAPTADAGPEADDDEVAADASTTVGDGAPAPEARAVLLGAADGAEADVAAGVEAGPPGVEAEAVAAGVDLEPGAAPDVADGSDAVDIEADVDGAGAVVVTEVDVDSAAGADAAAGDPTRVAGDVGADSTEDVGTPKATGSGVNGRAAAGDDVADDADKPPGAADLAPSDAEPVLSGPSGSNN
jgi:hypothetical protein